MPPQLGGRHAFPCNDFARLCILPLHHLRRRSAQTLHSPTQDLLAALNKQNVPTTQPDAKIARRPLPGSAGFISHLACQLKAPLDYIISDGGASTDVRRKLATNAQLLAGKKLVIWQFVERDIRLGKQGWQDIPLPPKLDD